MDESKPFLTTKDLAQEAAHQGRPVSLVYLQRLCQNGTLRASKPARDWLIATESARRWLRDWIDGR